MKLYDLNLNEIKIGFGIDKIVMCLTENRTFI